MSASSSTPGAAAFWLIVIAIGLGLCYSGVFYQTGAQFYRTCWQKAHTKGEASSPEQAAQWAMCEETADAALFNAGFVFSGNPENVVTPQSKAVVAACPSSYSDLPLFSGAWLLAVDMIEKSGGPALQDRFSPANIAVVRVFKTKWPHCAATAAANGFPRIVKRSNGKWEFETTCLPCKAEDQAMAKHQQEVQEWNSLSEEEKGRRALESLMRETPAPQAKPP